MKEKDFQVSNKHLTLLHESWGDKLGQARWSSSVAYRKGGLLSPSIALAALFLNGDHYRTFEFFERTLAFVQDQVRAAANKCDDLRIALSTS